MKLLGIVALVLFAFAASLKADIVTLDGGMTVEGIVTERGDKVEVRIGEGVLFYRKDVVKSIRRIASSLGEYEAKRAQLKPTDAEGHYQLGVWCRTKGLHVPARGLFEAAVKIDKKHGLANEALGHTKVGDEWLKEFDYQESKGNVRVRGGWLARDVARARDELTRMDNEARAGAIEAYYQRLQREAAASSGSAASGCGSDLSPGSAGPWIAETLWPTGAKLRVVFADGKPEHIAAVQSIAVEWTRFANLDFEFAPASADTSRDDIRISFAGVGAHSQLGRNSIAYARRGEPSINLNPTSHFTSSSSTRRTILHEFGHALGFLHEHQNPNRTFQWNEEAVQKHFSQYGMSKEEIQQNVLTSPVQGQGTAPGGKKFDPDSIMMYALPKETNTAGIEVNWNTVLSQTDQQTAAALYPGRTGTTSTATRAAPAGHNTSDEPRLSAALQHLAREVPRYIANLNALSPQSPPRALSEVQAQYTGARETFEMLDRAIASRVMALKGNMDRNRLSRLIAIASRMNALVQTLDAARAPVYSSPR